MLLYRMINRIKDRLNYMRLCNKFYIPGSSLNIEENDVIHVATYFIRDFLDNVVISKSNITLITCGYDDMAEMCMDQNDLDNTLENPNIKTWMMENCNFNPHPKLQYIYSYNDSEYIRLNHTRLSSKKKMNKVFYSSSVTSNPHERFYLPNTKTSNHQEYAEKMSEYKYVYIPCSWSGFDLSRIYEAVICGCIPIGKFTENFSNTFKDFNFVSLPGTVVTRFSHVHTNKLIYETVYIPENTIKNSIEKISFENEPEYKMTRQEAQRVFDFLFSFGEEYTRKFDIKHKYNSLEDFEKERTK